MAKAKRTVKRKAPPSKGWSFPAQSTRARQAAPSHVFGRVVKRTGQKPKKMFPFKKPSKPFNRRTGKYPPSTKWTVDPRGLYAGISRSGQTGDRATQRKLIRRVNPYRRKQGLSPLTQKKQR